MLPTCHEAAEMVLVEITEDFAACSSGQHPTVLSFKNNDLFFIFNFFQTSQPPKSSLLAQMIQG